MIRHLFTAAVLAAAGVASLPFASAQTGKVTVVTSFAKDVTDPFKKAFEKAHPGVTLDVQNRNTNAGVKFVEETKANNQTDLFWASAPDAFEVLKGKGLLQKYQPKAAGIPDKIGAFPVNEPEGHYFGFAASGYGIMWNTRYAQANKLPEPKDWQDLAKPAYFDHVSIAAPSRSGTTHLTIETILQGEGWEKGWRTIKEMAGNFRQVTERSFGVPEAVNSGQVGFGVVIDFFAFSAQASGFPVKFVYPTVTTIVPANVGHRRQCAEPRRGRGLRRVPALAGRPGGAARAEHPAPADQSGRLRQGPGRLSEPVQGSVPRRAREVRRRRVGEAHQRRRHAVRPDDHVPARAAQGRHQGDPRGRGRPRQEGQRASARPWSRRPAISLPRCP